MSRLPMLRRVREYLGCGTAALLTTALEIFKYHQMLHNASFHYRILRCHAQDSKDHFSDPAICHHPIGALEMRWLSCQPLSCCHIQLHLATLPATRRIDFPRPALSSEFKAQIPPSPYSSTLFNIMLIYSATSRHLSELFLPSLQSNFLH